MQKTVLYIPLYSITLLLSAGLIFVVQPLFSKMILPLLGGSPQVWNIAMVFFQGALLAGYAYAHLAAKIPNVRMQAALHIILLSGFAFLLPIALPEGTHPPRDGSPAFWQLSLMFVTVGGPFFILSASAPLLQKWFAQTGHDHASNPYFLYGASNLGSVSALLAYPTLIEPFLDTAQQGQLWTYGYIGLIALILFSSLCTGKQSSTTNKQQRTHVSWKDRTWWLCLAFIPSSLMLGVTTYVTTDVAAVPLLWVIPLALYVGTFIIAFARKPIISPQRTRKIALLLLILLIPILLQPNFNPLIALPFHIALFFFVALACHFKLASHKPHTDHLTEFYLLMSTGGVLGGIFNALLAPILFIVPLEYGLALIAACFVIPSGVTKQGGRIAVILGIIAVATLYSSQMLSGSAWLYIAILIGTGLIVFLMDQKIIFGLVMAVTLLLFPPGSVNNKLQGEKIIHADRSFFSALKVIDTPENVRLMTHGTTVHGTQAISEKHRLTKLSYYGTHSPLSDIFSFMDAEEGPQAIATIGLGVGVVACYQKAGRHFDFYEIDQKVIEIASNSDLFTFLSDCASPYDILLGDGRLEIEKTPNKSYDMILLDAFSSDNVPVHLLTTEAIKIYLSKLKDNGLLVFNVSNNFLDIEPVLQATSKQLDIPSFAKMSFGGRMKEADDLEYFGAHFLVMTKNKEAKNFLQQKHWSKTKNNRHIKAWTDSFSNIVSILGNQTVSIRAQENIQRRKTSKE